MDKLVARFTLDFSLQSISPELFWTKTYVSLTFHTLSYSTLMTRDWQEVNNLDSSLVVQELELTMNLIALYGLL